MHFVKILDWRDNHKWIREQCIHYSVHGQKPGDRLVSIIATQLMSSLKQCPAVVSWAWSSNWSHSKLCLNSNDACLCKINIRFISWCRCPCNSPLLWCETIPIVLLRCVIQQPFHVLRYKIFNNTFAVEHSPSPSAVFIKVPHWGPRPYKSAKSWNELDKIWKGS